MLKIDPELLKALGERRRECRIHHKVRGRARGQESPRAAVDGPLELPREGDYLLSGDGGLGKTILALMMGTSISSKTDWLGLTTMQGPFLYVGAEDDDDEIHRRVDQILYEMGLGWDALLDFHYKSLVGEDPVLATFDRNSQVMRPTPRLLAMEDKIRGLGKLLRDRHLRRRLWW